MQIIQAEVLVPNDRAIEELANPEIQVVAKTTTLVDGQKWVGVLVGKIGLVGFQPGESLRSAIAEDRRSIELSGDFDHANYTVFAHSTLASDVGMGQVLDALEGMMADGGAGQPPPDGGVDGDACDAADASRQAADADGEHAADADSGGGEHPSGLDGEHDARHPPCGGLGTDHDNNGSAGVPFAGDPESEPESSDDDDDGPEGGGDGFNMPPPRGPAGPDPPLRTWRVEVPCDDVLADDEVFDVTQKLRRAYSQSRSGCMLLFFMVTKGEPGQLQIADMCE